GESLLLAALVRMANGSESLALSDLAANADPTAVTLLLLAFGIKLAIPGLHFWIAPAYRVTPTPAVAALSGAMMNVGILGLVSLLPLGMVGFETAARWMIGLGLLGTFYGVIAGLLQRHPKAILGCSSMSQMGMVVAAMGLAMLAPSPAITAALLGLLTIYAIHHGLIKSTLFLLVDRGRVPASQRLWIAVLGLALAGLPLTSGWWAKAELKQLLGLVESQTGEPMSLVALALSISALTTTVLILHLLRRLKALAAAETSPGLVPPFVIPFVTLGPVALISVALCLAMPAWLLGQEPASPKWLDALWIIAGLAAFMLVAQLWQPSSAPRLRLLGGIAHRFACFARTTQSRLRALRPQAGHATPPISQPIRAATTVFDPKLNLSESGLRQWPVAGVSLLAVLLILVAGLWV
ncbi:MAG: proton-conducting transporter membrane subunit, partial [Gammaproteobacteria bacterium]